jgi:hypothetical protein
MTEVCGDPVFVEATEFASRGESSEIDIDLTGSKI